MKANIYCVFDKLSKSVASQLMVADSDELIMRTVKSAKLGEIIENNLEDFSLFHIGVICPEIPKIESLDTPRFVAHLESFKDV